jgi:hypothetical protein
VSVSDPHCDLSRRTRLNEKGRKWRKIWRGNEMGGLLRAVVVSVMLGTGAGNEGDTSTGENNAWIVEFWSLET